MRAVCFIILFLNLSNLHLQGISSLILNSGPRDGKLELNGEKFDCGKYTVDWEITGAFILFDIYLGTTPKYVAIGISSETEIFAGADVIGAEISRAGTITSLDYFVDADGETLMEDDTVSISTRFKSDGANPCGILEISRRLASSDPEDVSIVQGTRYSIILIDITGDEFPTSLRDVSFETQEICFGNAEECGGTTFGPITPITCGTESYLTSTTTRRTTTTTAPVISTPYTENELELNDGKYIISWHIHDPFITFEIASETTSPYVAVGISANELMFGADLIIVEVVEGAEIIVGDYHIASNGITIAPDPNQASGTLLEITDSVTKVRITRRLAVNDPEDLEIIKNVTYFLVWFEIDTTSFPNDLNELKYGLHEVCFGNNYECNGQTLPPPSTQVTTLSPGDGKLEFNGGKYRISWTIAGSFIQFEIECQTSGSFVALGITDWKGTVAGGDLMTAEFEDESTVAAGDYYIGNDGAKIVSDSTNHLSASIIEVTDSWKKVKLTRRLFTDDGEDISIIESNTYSLIWFEIETQSFPATLYEPGVKFGTQQVCFGTNEECSIF